MIRVSRLFRLYMVGGLTALLSASGDAATYTWKGNGTKWGKEANWSPTGVPSRDDCALFAGNPRQDPTVNINSAIAALTFAAGVRTITISGSAYTLSLVLGMTNNSVNQQVITAPLNLLGSQEWKAAAGNFSIGGDVNLNAYTLTVSGDHDTVISGTISGTGGITKNGGGTLTLGAANSFSGSVNINEGTLILDDAGALGSVASVTLNGGTLSLHGSGDRVNNGATIHLSGGSLETKDVSEEFGVLIVSGDSAIVFDTDGVATTLTFAEVHWTAGTLTIYGWRGRPGGDTEQNKVDFLNRPDNTFLSHVIFAEFGAGSTVVDLGGSWELVPVPETPEYALVGSAGLLVFAVYARLKRTRC